MTEHDINEQENAEQRNCNISASYIPEELNDALKELPVEQKNKVLHSVSLFMQRSISPVSSPLLDKLDTDLVGKLIDNSEKESIRDYEQNKFDKVCGIVVLVFVLITVAVLIYLFRNHIEDIRDFLMPIIYIGVGAIGGYGYKGIKERN